MTISPYYANITIPSPKGQNERFMKFHEFLKERGLVDREPPQAFGREDILVSREHDGVRFRVEAHGTVEYNERFKDDMWKVLDRLAKYKVLQYAGVLPDITAPQGTVYHTYLLRVPIKEFIEELEDTSTPESKW